MKHSFINSVGVLAQSVFERFSQILHARTEGVLVSAPDWICPQAVESITIPLDGSAARPEISVALRDGVSAQTLPEHFGVSPSLILPIRYVRAPRACAQLRQLPPVLERAHQPADLHERGTATALVRDRLAPDRCYILTCGHVVAPDMRTRFGDHIRIIGFGDELTGRLCEWQPALGSGMADSPLDAALVELDSASVLALRQELNGHESWLPAGVSDEIRLDMVVRLQRLSHNDPLEGALKVRWSGSVRVGEDEHCDYFLRDALGYTTFEPTIGGDSGAALWTSTDLLLGMHIASITPDGAFGANAVMGRISPVLEWFCVKPFTRGDPATVTSEELSARMDVPPRDLPPLSNDAGLPIFAKTLWGEARGEGLEGMKAVACVVINRLQTGYRGKHDIAAVCLDPWQFSCWNGNDPNRAALDRIDARYDTNYACALEIAILAVEGRLPDITRGARHYVALSLRNRPPWLANKTPCAVIGRHEFYNNIA